MDYHREITAAKAAHATTTIMKIMMMMMIYAFMPSPEAAKASCSPAVHVRCPSVNTYFV